MPGRPRSTEGNLMFTKAIAVLGLTAAIACGGAATASADNGLNADPQAIMQGFLQGLTSGSTGGPSRQSQSWIYPDYYSCNQAANQLRRSHPGSIAECNPVGGASSQYQLVYLPPL